MSFVYCNNQQIEESYHWTIPQHFSALQRQQTDEARQLRKYKYYDISIGEFRILKFISILHRGWFQLSKHKLFLVFRQGT